jgi:5,10-methylenetetrahydrofolate reductase
VDAFSVISEIESPTTPDLRHVRHQIGVLSPVSDAFLMPDNHLGRATVSSVAVAHEVQAMGGRSVACINARPPALARAHPVDMPVYAGVMVLASAAMARRLAASIPDIAIPDELVRRVGADPVAGVEAACEQITTLRETGAFAGVHLVPVSRYRQVSARLETALRG